AVVPPGGNAVSVLLNNGDGTFATAPAYATGQRPFEVAAGDFTGHGKPNLVTIGGGTHLLVNNGDGTFGNAIPLDKVDLRKVVTAASDDDGTVDLAGFDLGANGPLQVSVYLGDGTFQARKVFDVGDAVPIGELVARDFNGDGKLDLAVLYRHIT